MNVVVGLGGNLGDRLAMLREATRLVGQLAPAHVTARSRVYETAPVGGPEQGPFLNAAIGLTWGADPLALMNALLGVERSLGRVRDVRWGPRTIDLDVLWIEGRTVDIPRLVVPHPGLASRAFAILPLLDVAPDARDPRSGARYVAPGDQIVTVRPDLVL